MGGSQQHDLRATMFEPNEMIAAAVGRQLEGAGIAFEWSAQMDADNIIVRDNADAVILGDVPNQAEWIAYLRNRNIRAAVLCLIERRCARTAAELLDAGADDVMVKPVAGVELRARIAAARRRSFGTVVSSVREGRLLVHLDGRAPEVDGTPMRLSQRENAILAALAQYRRRLLPKERIHSLVYGDGDFDPLDKVIDVYICKLRKKIAEATGGARYIETVYGRGYKFEAPPEHRAAVAGVDADAMWASASHLAGTSSVTHAPER
jgi:two-component system, cell cycle response regulator CtrA